MFALVLRFMAYHGTVLMMDYDIRTLNYFTARQGAHEYKRPSCEKTYIRGHGKNAPHPDANSWSSERAAQTLLSLNRLRFAVQGSSSRDLVALPGRKTSNRLSPIA